MRKFINIINESQLDQRAITDVYEIISNYVTFGEWASPTQFDRPLSRIAEILPRPDYSMELYRVLRLNDDQLSLYEIGKLVMEPRKFSSWTKDYSIAKRMAQSKGDNCIIVNHTFPADKILIDVKDFYDEHQFDDYHFTEYHKYVVREEEVIVMDSGPLKITSSNSEMHVNEPSTPPMIGDVVFFEDGDDYSEEIDDVDSEQPYSNRGIYSVSTEDGRQHWVTSLGGGQWEIVNEINESE